MNEELYQNLLIERATIDRKIYQIEREKEKEQKQKGLEFSIRLYKVRQDVNQGKRPITSEEIRNNVEFEDQDILFKRCSEYAQREAARQLSMGEIHRLKPMTSEESRAAYLALPDELKNPPPLFPQDSGCQCHKKSQEPKADSL